MCGALLLSLALPASAQDEVILPPAQPKAATGPPVTVRGEVRNAATGQPLPRALVKLGDGEGTGALTDGEGRFEILDVPAGMETFLVVKPGFRPGSSVGGSANPHLVMVTATTPPLSFSMLPDNAISGHVEVSSGDPAPNIGITLLRLAVQDGRAIWAETGSRQTDMEGNYRFAGLEDGTYLVKTQSAYENEVNAPTETGTRVAAELRGFPVVFYSNATDAAGASRISLAGGQQAQANLILTATPFHAIAVTLVKPPGGSHWQFQPSLQDRSGQKLDYAVAYEEKSRSVRGFLPDGSYTLIVSGSSDEGTDRGDVPLSRLPAVPKDVAGLLDFTVAGHDEKGLRVPLSSGVSTPIHVRYEPAAPAARQARDQNGEIEQEPPPLGLWLKRTGAGGSEEQENATWADNDLFELGAVAPGAYWVQASANRTGSCLGAVTSGGVNMGRAPLIVGASGAGPSIEAVVRTDCAKVTLQLPTNFAVTTAGEQQSFVVYLVPEFDSVGAVQSFTLWPPTEATAEVQDVTPGTYRVLVMDRQVDLEYHNPAAMEAWAGKGQKVVVSPGAAMNVMLEVPTR